MEFFAIIWEIVLIIFLAAKVLISELYNIIKQSLQAVWIYAENNKSNPDDEN